MSRSRFWFDRPPAPSTFTQALEAGTRFGQGAHIIQSAPSTSLMLMSRFF